MVRAVLIVVCLAGCSFDGRAADDTPGDDDDDLPAGQEQIKDTELGAGTFVSTSLAAPGVIEPAAYAVGGLRARSYQGYNRNGRQYFLEGTTSWSDLEESLESVQQGTAYYRVPDPGNTFNAAPYLGIGQDDYVLLLDGELRVTRDETTPAVRTLRVDPDDAIYVELDGSEPVAVYTDINDDPQVRMFTVPEGVDWIPIRIATEDLGLETHTRVSLDGAPLTADMLRARVNDHHGVHVRASENFYTQTGEAVATDLDELFRDQAPLQFPDAGSDRFGLRYVGQLYIDADATYEFEAGVENPMHDNARVRIDGRPAARTWFGETEAPTPISLTVGWHDLLVDFGDESSTAAIHIRMRRAGEASFQPIAPDALRPIAAGGLHTLAFNGGFNMPVTANGSVTAQLLPEVPPDAVVEFQDVFLTLEPTTMAGATATVDTCTTEPFPLRGVRTEFLEASEACRDLAAQPVSITVTSTGSTFSVTRPGVATAYRGGTRRPPYIAEGVYESRILATPGATGLVALAIEGELRGGTIRSFVRSGADPTLEPWVETAADGTVPSGTPAGERTQYRIILETGGWNRPTVESVTLTYATQ